MGKTRDFTIDTVNEVRSIVKDIEQNSDTCLFDDIADWFTNDWDIEQHLGDVNEYYNHMVDNNDITLEKFEKILQRVKYVDIDYHNRFTNIGIVQNSFAQSLINKAAMLTPKAISLPKDKYGKLLNHINSSYKIYKETAYDGIKASEDSMIDLDDPTWYEKIMNTGLGAGVSIARSQLDGLGWPFVVGMQLADKVLGTEVSKKYQTMLDDFEELTILNNLVTDKESYYEGRVAGDKAGVVTGALTALKGLALIGAGALGEGAGLALDATGIGAIPGLIVNALSTEAIVAGTSVVADGLVASASAYEDIDKSVAKQNEAKVGIKEKIRLNETTNANAGNVTGGNVSKTSYGKSSGSSAYQGGLESIIKNGTISIDDIKANPSIFSGKSVDEIAKVLTDSGYDVTVKASTRSRSGAQIIKINNPGGGKNISQVQVSPGGGRHGSSPYVKISTTDQGIIKIIDGTESLYKTDGKETATIIFSGGK